MTTAKSLDAPNFSNCNRLYKRRERGGDVEVEPSQLSAALSLRPHLLLVTIETPSGTGSSSGPTEEAFLGMI